MKTRTELARAAAETNARNALMRQGNIVTATATILDAMDAAAASDTMILNALEARTYHGKPNPHGNCVHQVADIWTEATHGPLDLRGAVMATLPPLVDPRLAEALAIIAEKDAALKIICDDPDTKAFHPDIEKQLRAAYARQPRAK